MDFSGKGIYPAPDCNFLFSSVTGPTLPSLADNCNVHNSDVSIIFTFRAVGIFVGACLVGRFFPKLGKGI